MIICDCKEVSKFIKYLELRDKYYQYKNVSFNEDEVDVYYTLMNTHMSFDFINKLPDNIDSNILIEQDYRDELTQKVNNCYFNYLMKDVTTE